MATVLPFAGIRPQAQLAEKVAAPPYDVINSEEAREIARGNPQSFLHINKPEIDLPLDVDAHSDLVYQQGRKNLHRFIDEGILSKDPSAGFYLYRQISPGKIQPQSQTGIVALVSCDDYENNIIKKHELTRPEKEDDRVKHMQALAAQTGPVFLTYRADALLDSLMADCSQVPPVFEFSSEGVKHQFWTVTDAEYITKISARFQQIPALFVADGHHRSAAAVRYRSHCREQNKDHKGSEAYNYFMAVLFPHAQLNILGYHRVVKDLGTYDCQSFLEALRREFKVTICKNGENGENGENDKHGGNPEKPGQFGMYIDNQWYRLTFNQMETMSGDVVANLDVSILQNRVLSPLLNINDPRKDQRIGFIGGIRGQSALEQAVDSGEYAVAFSCFPVSIDALLEVAEQDKLMPPKSTWFEPKLKSGLVIHSLE